MSGARLPDSPDLMAVVLAAGRGKRLHPITTTRTKAMAPVFGKPIIERVMETLVINGIHSFIIVASPDDDEMVEYFNQRPRLQAGIKIIHQTEPLGMGHALLQASPHIDQDFVLSSCDNLVNPEEIRLMLSTWTRERPNAILTTLQVGPREIIRMGIVELDGNNISRIVEKPGLEDAPSNIGSVPLYVFARRFLDYLPEIKPSPRGEYELQDAIQMLVDRENAVRAFELSGRRDLTTPADLLAINLHYLGTSPGRNWGKPAHIGANSRVINPVFFEPGVNIGSDCTIGPNVCLERGCQVGDRVHLQNSMVLRGRMVPDGSIECERVIW